MILLVKYKQLILIYSIFNYISNGYLFTILTFLNNYKMLVLIARLLF
jgi:hypothetical protein